MVSSNMGHVHTARTKSRNNYARSFPSIFVSKRDSMVFSIRFHFVYFLLMVKRPIEWNS